MFSDYKKTFIVNSLSGWGGKIFQIAYAIIVTPLLLSGLGKERYGAWVLVGQLVTYLVMLDLGVGSSVARYYARHISTNDTLSNKHLYSTTQLILALVGVAVFIISCLIRNGLADFYSIQQSIYKDFTTALILSGFCLAATLPCRVFNGILQAHHKLYCIDLAIFISSSVRFLAIIWLTLYESLNLTNLALILLAAEVLKYLIMSVMVRRLSTSAIGFSFKMVKWDMTKKIYSLGIASFLSSLLKTIRLQVPITIVGTVMGAAMVPIISIPLSLLSNVGALAGRIGTIFTAVSSELDAVGKKDRIESLNIEVTKLLLLITFAGGLLITFFAYPILNLWLKDSIDKNTIAMMSRSLLVMAVPYFVLVSLTGIKNTLMATGYHFSVALFTAVITCGCFSLFFVSPNRVINVAYIIAVTVLLISLSYVYQFSCYMDKSFWYVCKKIFFRPTSFGVLLAVSFWVVRGQFDSELPRLLCFCMMAVLAATLTAEHKQRRLIFNILRLRGDSKDDK